MKTAKYIFVVLTSFVVLSCQDFLEKPPLDQVGLDDYWKSTIDLKNYVAKFYIDLPRHENNRHSGYQEEESDNLVYTRANALLNGENTLSTGSWQYDFTPVRSINIFFDNYKRCEDQFSSYQHYLGEAQFFKAWIYFNLVQKYGDVPWYTHALTVNDEEELTRPRDSRVLVVDSILSLLDKAIVNLDKRDLAPWNNNSVNKEAALAFKTRVALFEGTWQKYHANTSFGSSGAQPSKYFQLAVSAAEELINGDYNVGIYSTNKPKEDYYYLFGTGSMADISEVLLHRAYSIADIVGHNQNYYAANAPNELGATWSYVTSHLGLDGNPIDYLALAETAKGNEFLLELDKQIDPRLRQNIWIPGDITYLPGNLVWEKPGLFEDSRNNCPTGFQIKKYTNPNQTLDYAQSNDAGKIIFRYGEVLLNYAEALYELNQTVAYDELNMLRARVGMPDFKVNAQSEDPNLIDYGYDISDELYEIRRERRVELAFESFRQWDWKRWAAGALFTNKRPKGYPFDSNEYPNENPLLDENSLIDLLQNIIPNGYNFNANRDYLNSVPQTELTVNPNLDQNPGW
ncbi:RagB/SusD family nutrient uptake outer membrane protein [Membranihabitans marinus]|uniref:RagB/SusD family nutrient uptake outer membrane protein n=1 Tax=Membranihabitans marinus TaxID=1227546 RepID=UPI001F38FDF6|nr:RagB/SusD family nutrient uptake outer membrane protein [Membranihabitans marinus]